jgi:hypothetical protein
MQIREVQMFLLMQGQTMKIKSGGKMELTHAIKGFRTDFKQAIGLNKKASDLDVLMGVGFVYSQFGKLDKYFEYLNQPNNLVDGKPLVTEEMLTRFCAGY